MLLRVSGLVLIASVLTGCASVVKGVNQSVSVRTMPVTGTSCRLSNSKCVWCVPETPGSVLVHRL